MTKRTAQRENARVRHHLRYVAFFLPLLLAGAYLNMGQSSCGGGGNTPTCQGLAVTHFFSSANGSTAHATDGDDVIRVTSATSPLFVFAGDGDDTVCVTATGGNVAVFGQLGDDSIQGGTGNDILFGDQGNDTVFGGAGNDTLSGGPGNDMLFGGDGDDTVTGDDDSDQLNGGNGADVLYGGDDRDFALHNGGLGDNNVLNGDAGNDTLYSEHIRGTLDGGSGSDIAHVCGNEQLIDIEAQGNEWCPVETAEIFSARLAITFCNSQGSEKYWPLDISLTGQMVRRLGNELFVVPQFGAGSTHVYDFLIDKPAGGGVPRVNQIREIELFNDWGIDDFCVSRVRLGINHFTEGTWNWDWLFDSGWTQIWIYGRTGYTFSFNTLRNHENWTMDNATSVGVIQSTGMDYETLIRLIEGIALDAGEGPHDNPDWVQVSRGTQSCTVNGDCPLGSCQAGECLYPNEAAVRLVLHAEIPFNLRDWVRIDFVLRATCENNQIKITPDEFTANADGGLDWAAERTALQKIGELAASFTAMVDLPPGTTCGVVAPHFDDCGLWLGALNQPRPAGSCQ